MIVVKLIGGLGNQMFQYALGRHLSIRNKMDLKLDLSGFKSPGTNTPRHYELMIFPIDVKFVEEADVQRFGDLRIHNLSRTKNSQNNSLISLVKLTFQNKIPPRFITLVSKVLFLFGRIKLINDYLLPPSYCRKNVSKNRFYHQNYIFEYQINFDPDILNIKWPAYLVGYWQSEKYFKRIEKRLVKEFNFKNPLNGKNFAVANEISQNNSVSIHIRRGDYVTLPYAVKMHGNICDLDYYSKAIKIIASKVKEPHFFVFSDDISWAKENLRIDYPKTYVNFNTDENSYEDMRLMSLCKHNIIANSSFSWWGAWLNRNVGKIVVAPKKWLNDPTKDTRDVIPDNWLKI